MVQVMDQGVIEKRWIVRAVNQGSIERATAGASG
jgi:hypothetical protein